MSNESMANFKSCIARSDKMLPVVDKILNQVYNNQSDLIPLRNQIKNEHILDKYFGIDCVVKIKDNIDPFFHITLQVKTLGYKWWSNKRYWKDGYLNFCQEHMNAYGTEHERPGEWSYLTSQMIFLGYMNEQETDFCDWYIINTLSYKLKIKRFGGLIKFGDFHPSSSNGISSYYTLSLKDFQDCIIDSKALLQTRNLMFG